MPSQSRLSVGQRSNIVGPQPDAVLFKNLSLRRTGHLLHGWQAESWRWPWAWRALCLENVAYKYTACKSIAIPRRLHIGKLLLHADPREAPLWITILHGHANPSPQRAACLYKCRRGLRPCATHLRNTSRRSHSHSEALWICGIENKYPATHRVTSGTLPLLFPIPCLTHWTAL